MKIIHTAEWHIGQLFQSYDRTIEHQQFTEWLVNVFQVENIDTSLICANVFDLSSSSSNAIKQLYTFLKKVVKGNPVLQIIVISCNRDSLVRFEIPKPHLETSNIYFIGYFNNEKKEPIYMVHWRLIDSISTWIHLTFAQPARKLRAISDINEATEPI